MRLQYLFDKLNIQNNSIKKIITSKYIVILFFINIVEYI